MSLLPICAKIFGCLSYSSLFEFFIENDLVSFNQSGFKPGDFCITHEIYKPFDVGYEVRGVFLDVSKAIDNVCHNGLIVNLIYQKLLIKFGTMDLFIN